MSSEIIKVVDSLPDHKFAFREPPTVKISYTYTVLLHNKVQELYARATHLAPDATTVSESRGTLRVVDTELTVAGHRLFGKDRANDRKGGQRHDPRSFTSTLK